MNQLAKTALWTAAARAYETTRKDRLFNDPLAKALAGDIGEEFFHDMDAQDNPYLIIRTRYFDDVVQSVVKSGVRQMVLLASGLDVRAFRLNLPSDMTLYELDQPELFAYKEPILQQEQVQPICRRITIDTDLIKDDWTLKLLESDFNTAHPTLWIAEGLLEYLPIMAVQNLMQKVNQLSAAKSWFTADVLSAAFFTSKWTVEYLQKLEDQGTPFLFGTDVPEDLFDASQWSVDVKQVGQEGANFGRWPYPISPRNMTEVPRTFLVTAQKD